MLERGSVALGSGVKWRWKWGCKKTNLNVPNVRNVHLSHEKRLRGTANPMILKEKSVFGVLCPLSEKNVMGRLSYWFYLIIQYFSICPRLYYTQCRETMVLCKKNRRVENSCGTAGTACFLLKNQCVAWPTRKTLLWASMGMWSVCEQYCIFCDQLAV